MIKQSFIVIATFSILLGLWEVCSQVAQEKLVFVLPPPSNIILTVYEKADRFLFHTLVTTREMAGGFLIAFLVAFPLAWGMVHWTGMRLVLQPLFILTQSIPMFALAPIMVIWFGWSYTAIVIPTALMIFFPLTLNMYQGFRATPMHLIDYFRVNGATEWQLFYKLRLPYAIPHIFAGFRISAAVAGIGAVAGEWAGAQAGLGLLMLESRRGADLEVTFGALLCLTALSLTLYGVVTAVEQLIHPKTLRSIRSMARKSMITGTLIIFSLLLTSCQQPAPKTRLLLDWLPNPDHVPLYVGIEKGFFSGEEIELDILKVRDPSDVVPFLTSGQAEIGISYMTRTMRSMARGARVKVIGSLIDEPLSCIIVPKDSHIHTVKDLDGCVIGLCGSGFGTTFIDALFARKEIAAKSKKIVSFDLVAALGTAQVDAIYEGYWNIESEHLASLGYPTRYFKLEEFGIPNYHELIFLAPEKAKEAKPEFVERFQRALQKSIDFSRDHPDEAFEIYLAANPDKFEKTQTWERNSWELTRTALAKRQGRDDKLWKNLYQWMLEEGMLEAPFDYHRAFPEQRDAS